jgi:hypothetical protein
LRIVSWFRCCALASLKNFSTASAIVGTSGFFTTPISPAASQSRTRSVAADQERKNSGGEGGVLTCLP